MLGEATTTASQTPSSIIASVVRVVGGVGHDRTGVLAAAGMGIGDRGDLDTVGVDEVLDVFDTHHAAADDAVSERGHEVPRERLHARDVSAYRLSG